MTSAEIDFEQLDEMGNILASYRVRFIREDRNGEFSMDVASIKRLTRPSCSYTDIEALEWMRNAGLRQAVEAIEIQTNATCVVVGKVGGAK